MEAKIKNIKTNKRKGLALDIDETLSWTVGYWIEQMEEKFGNPENLAVKELVLKYRLAQNVPYWQSKEALDWMETHRNSNKIHTKLPLIENSSIIVKKISKIIPIIVYITARPERVINGTEIWLRKHNFPDLPIICKPNNIPTEDGNKWKAKVLERLYPNVKGIIDDNPNLLNFFSLNYKGFIFLYDNNYVDSKLKAIPCKDWQAVYNEVKKVF